MKPSEAFDLLNSLLDGDRLALPAYGSTEQELAILVMRDTLGWVLCREPGLKNITRNLANLAKLRRKMDRHVKENAL